MWFYYNREIELAYNERLGQRSSLYRNVNVDNYKSDLPLLINFVKVLYVVRFVFDFTPVVADLADSHEKEVVCWIETSTVSEETTNTSSATQTPKASEISAKRSW